MQKKYFKIIYDREGVNKKMADPKSVEEREELIKKYISDQEKEGVTVSYRDAVLATLEDTEDPETENFDNSEEKAEAPIEIVREAKEGLTKVVADLETLKKSSFFSKSDIDKIDGCKMILQETIDDSAKIFSALF